MTERRKETRRKKKEGESSEWLENRKQVGSFVFDEEPDAYITSHHLPDEAK
jgi:hypothetical protein